MLQLPRKKIVKVVLSNEQHAVLREVAKRLGTSESEILRTAFMSYVKDLGVLQQMMVTTSKKPLVYEEVKY